MKPDRIDGKRAAEWLSINVLHNFFVQKLRNWNRTTRNENSDEECQRADLIFHLQRTEWLLRAAFFKTRNPVRTLAVSSSYFSLTSSVFLSNRIVYGRTDREKAKKPSSRFHCWRHEVVSLVSTKYYTTTASPNETESICLHKTGPV